MKLKTTTQLFSNISIMDSSIGFDDLIDIHIKTT